MNSSHSEDEYRELVSKLSLIDVNSALFSIDSEKHPARLKLLHERKSKLEELEKFLVDHYSSVDRVGFGKRMALTGSHSKKMALGDFEISWTYRGFEIRKKDLSHLKVSGRKLLDEAGREIGSVDIGHGLERDRHVIKISTSDLSYLLLERKGKGGPLEYLSGNRKYSVRTERTLIGELDVEYSVGKIEFTGFYYEGSEPELWFLALSMVNEAVLSDGGS